jgi:hypothetical protein
MIPQFLEPPNPPEHFGGAKALRDQASFPFCGRQIPAIEISASP